MRDVLKDTGMDVKLLDDDATLEDIQALARKTGRLDQLDKLTRKLVKK
jgi:hypothetical protein